MAYKFMGVLTGSQAEKELAMLFERLLAELRDQTQDHYDALVPLFAAAPAVDRTVPAKQTADGQANRIIPIDQPLDKDCCDTLRIWRDGTLPMINSTYHLSVIDMDACTGCGTCRVVSYRCHCP